MSEKTNNPLQNKEEVLKVLDKISLFGGLVPDQLDEVLDLLEEVSYKKGEMIFKQGTPPSHIYIILSGKVKIALEKNEYSYVLLEYGLGNCFGEMSVIGILPHSASAIASEETKLIVLPRRALMSLYKDHKDIFGILVLNIARETSRRLYKSDDTLLQYVLKEEFNNK